MARLPSVYSSMLAIVLLLNAAQASAQDLALQEVSVLRVGACENQIRFQVAYKEGSIDGLSYRIGVYSTARNKLLTAFDVTAHKRGETLYFVVPGSALLCDRQVDIRVDDQNRISESDKRNNIVTVKIEKPQTGGLADPCTVPPEKCQ